MGNKEGMKWISRPKWENDGSAERTQALTEYCWVSGCGGQRGCGGIDDLYRRCNDDHCNK